jgi:hypothetical protein
MIVSGNMSRQRCGLGFGNSPHLQQSGGKWGVVIGINLRAIHGRSSHSSEIKKVRSPVIGLIM